MADHNCLNSPKRIIDIDKIVIYKSVPLNYFKNKIDSLLVNVTLKKLEFKFMV